MAFIGCYNLFNYFKTKKSGALNADRFFYFNPKQLLRDKCTKLKFKSQVFIKINTKRIFSRFKAFYFKCWHY